MDDEKAEPSEEAQLVSRGEFSIDRTQALRSLEKYQFLDPWHFVRAWLRVAVHQRAIRVEVQSTDHASDFFFEGAALPSELLTDPFTHLLSPGAAAVTEGGRQLAIGLLGCMRLEPQRITLRSGVGPAGRRWLLLSRGEEITEDDPNGSGNHLRIDWGDRKGGNSAARFAQEIRATSGMYPLPISVDGKMQPPYPLNQGKNTRMVDVEGRRIILRGDLGNTDGIVALYKNGVFIEKVSASAMRDIECHVNDDEFTLDLSTVHCINGQRYDATMSLAVETAISRYPPQARHGIAHSLTVLAGMTLLFLVSLLFSGAAFEFAFIFAFGPYPAFAPYPGPSGGAVVFLLFLGFLGVYPIVKCFHSLWVHARRLWSLVRDF